MVRSRKVVAFFIMLSAVVDSVTGTITKVLLPLLILGLVPLFADAAAISERLPLRGLDTRREISAARPIFHFHINLIYKDNGSDVDDNIRLIEDIYHILPEDIRDYFVFHIYGGWGCPKESVPLLYKKMNDLGMYFDSWGYDTPPERIEKMFQAYEFYVGTYSCEIGGESDGVDKACKTLPGYLTLCDRYGGYTFWSIQGMCNPLTQVAARHPEHFELMRKYSSRFILGHRNNSIGKTFTGYAEILGSWLSGHADNWWFTGQDWAWHEAGFTALFGEEARERTQPDTVVLMYPESLMGIEWLEAASLGATVFSLEAGDHIYTSRDGRRLTPGFKYVIQPLIRKMVTGKLIPSREEVLSNLRVVYARADIQDRHCAGSRISEPLYGPHYDDHKEWLPYSGRYFRLPIIQARASTAESDRGLFETVFEENSMPTGYEAVRCFNERYPRRSAGDSWSARTREHWLIANPNINHNRTSCFEVKLDRNRAAGSLAGVLTPHTFAIVRDDAVRVDVHLSNYRVDTEKDVWGNRQLMATNLWAPAVTEYVNHAYCENPRDQELRESILSLHGLSAAPRIASLTGGETGYELPFEYTETWDAKAGQYSVKIRHNGPVDVTIDTAGIRREALAGNLAFDATIRASSHASFRTIPDNAIDGNSRSSRWEAGQRKPEAESQASEEWLEVDLRGPESVRRVVLREYLDRVTDYRLEYLAGDRWIELARGTTIGKQKEHAFEAVELRKLRLRILGWQPDSFGMGAAPALTEFEIFGEKTGLGGVASRSAAVTDVYEAEDDAVLSDGAVRITDRDYFYRVFGAGFVRLPETGKPTVRFLVTAAEAGPYRVGLRYSRGDWFGAGDGWLQVDVNGRSAATLGLPQLGAWDHWRVSEAVVELRKGINAIDCRNDGGHQGVCSLDHIQVTRVDGQAVPPEPRTNDFDPARATLADENWHDFGSARVDGGASLLHASPGYRGSGYASLGPQTGCQAGVQVVVPESGYYRASLRYGVPPGWSWRESTAHLYVDDRKATTLIAGTKTPGKWILEEVLLYLHEGRNRLSFSVDPGDTGAVLIDGIVLAERPDTSVKAVAGIRIEGSAEQVPVNGYTRSLQAVLEPSDATIRAVTWSSSDPSVASVRPTTADGLTVAIKGHRPGVATVRAFASDKGQTAEHHVTVLNEINIAPEAKLSIDAASLSDWLRKCVSRLTDGDLTEKDCWNLGNDPRQPLPAHVVRLDWDRPRAVKTIVLHGRLAAGFEKGVCRLDDGSEIPFVKVQGKAAVSHAFEPPRLIRWLEFRILETRQWHAGLREIEVFSDE